MNPLLKTETDHQYQGDQTATNHAERVCGTQQPHSASDPAVPHGCQSAGHWAAAGKNNDELASAKAQRIYMHGEALKLQARPFSGVDAACYRLTRHIDKSIPWHLQASPSTACRIWFSVHHTVAVSVLRQAHAAVCRLGLTRVPDTTGFLAEHCRWYGWFCSFSSCVTRVLQ